MRTKIPKVVIFGIALERQPVYQDMLPGVDIVFASCRKEVFVQARTASVVVAKDENLSGIFEELKQQGYEGGFVPIACNSKGLGNWTSHPEGKRLPAVCCSKAPIEIAKILQPSLLR